MHFGPGPTCTNYVDPQSGQRRLAQRGDAALTAKTCEALDNIDYVMGLGLLDNVTSVLAPVYEFAEMMANTTKPVLGWAYSTETLSDIYRIGVAIAGGEAAWQRRPNFAYFATYKSPLQHAKEYTGNILWAAEHGIPLIYLGGDGRAGFAGDGRQRPRAVSGGGAERRGHRPAQAARRADGDRQRAGGDGLALSAAGLRLAGDEFAQRRSGGAGALCGRAVHGHGRRHGEQTGDAQAAAEAAIQVLMSALSGASMVHDMGFLDCADIGSLPYLVLLDEIVAMTKRIMRGIPVNRDTIMLDLIEEGGAGG